ncbi:MAG TPA: CHAT domain-containing protein [Candidatus Obscuribacterales bacterium]
MGRFNQRLYRLPFLFLVGCILCIGLNAIPVWLPGTGAIAQTRPVNQLVQQGIQIYAAGNFTEAIALWQQALLQPLAASEQATVHTHLAEAYRQVGKLDRAIAHWDQAIQIYRAQNNDNSRGLIAQLLTQQAQAYSNLGQHQRAINLLNSAINIPQKNPDPIVAVIAQGALANAYRGLGDYEKALTANLASLKIAQELKNPNYITTAWNNLGNIYTSRAERYQYQFQVAKAESEQDQQNRLNKLVETENAAALNAYEQSFQESRKLGGIAEVRALLNLNRLLAKSPNSQKERMISNRERALALLADIPESREKAFALINLADMIQTGILPPAQSQVVGLLEKAITVAKNVGDNRSESFALGTLGSVYESAKEYQKAMDLTRQAQFAAQRVNAADSLYRWQWQAGRILKATGERQQAIASYEQAIVTLQSIRGDIVAVSKELQFNFRDSVEPVYRELIGLLLDNSTIANSQLKSQTIAAAESKNIGKVLDTLELLKLAELQNFFGDECVQVAQANAKNNAKADTTAAVIYSVILNDRAATILQLPNKSLKVYPISMGSEELQKEIDKLRYLLEDQTTEEYYSQAQKIYDALIRPLEADLAAAKPSTLVFIPDRELRKVPMSALHDGQKFLIEKYAIGTTPSLSLTSLNFSENRNLQALVMGLTVERPPFASLPNVKDEVEGVQRILGGTNLVDNNFTLAKLEGQLKKQNYPIIHMATHGRFGPDAASTFLVAFDTNISIEELDNLLRSQTTNSGGSSQSREPVELLTLSACQTAAGDNRSALGIAGVAVRAGVKSALASLWYINDQATVPLIEEFYTQLRKPNITKAEALQKAQLKMIANQDYSHPALWSPFILIGSWL